MSEDWVIIETGVPQTNLPNEDPKPSSSDQSPMPWYDNGQDAALER